MQKLYITNNRHIKEQMFLQIFCCCWKFETTFSKSILIFTWDKVWFSKNKPCFYSDFLFFFFKFMIFHFQDIHGVKSVQKRSYFWLDYRKIRPEVTPYLDIFSAVISANIFLRILR